MLPPKIPENNFWSFLRVIPLDQGLATGLIIVACAAGAPFLPKLVQVAKDDAAFSVGMMTLLMVVTVVYLPLVLPTLLPGASVAPGDMAKSLIFSVLLPLGIGLFIKARYAETAGHLQPHMSQVSSLAIVFMLVGVLVLQFSTIIATIGSGGILAVLAFLIGSLLIGMLLGSKDPAKLSVMGLGTVQRNLAAAMLVAAQNFSDQPNVLVMVMLVAILGLILLTVVGGELGKRMPAVAVASASPVEWSTTNHATEVTNRTPTRNTPNLRPRVALHPGLSLDPIVPNYGILFRKRIPRCAKLISPGLGQRPPPTRPAWLTV